MQTLNRIIVPNVLKKIYEPLFVRASPNRLSTTSQSNLTKEITGMSLIDSMALNPFKIRDISTFDQNSSGLNVCYV